eukprot:scaffold39030_cov33-Phaeocystis_antarctica.AAC.1
MPAARHSAVSCMLFEVVALAAVTGRNLEPAPIDELGRLPVDAVLPIETRVPLDAVAPLCKPGEDPRECGQYDSAVLQVFERATRLSRLRPKPRE